VLASARIALAVLIAPSLAVADWEFQWAHPRPQGNALHGLAFPTATRGCAVGGSGAVLRSDDGGGTWELLQDHRAIFAGRFVRVLEDADREPGRYTVRWDARNEIGRPVAAGVYFYSLEAGDFPESKRVMLIR
jgi:hypothetical protein